MAKAVLVAGIALLSGCVSTFYVPQETELTVTIEHNSDFANLELIGILVADSSAEATLQPKTDAAGQWMEPNKAIFRSAQWGPEVALGNSHLKAVWHVSLSPAAGHDYMLKLRYTKGNIGTLDITVEGMGEDGTPLKVSRHVLAGSGDANNAVLFNTSGKMKAKQ